MVADSNKIFIIGSPRSGTSILGRAIRNALNLKSTYSEFHIFPLYSYLIEGANKFNANPTSKEARTINGMYLHDIPVSKINREVKNSIRRLYKDVSEDGSFVDKTPGLKMISEVPNIFNVFPKAKIIFAKRRGLENVVSRTVKFQNVGFEEHCNQWVSSMNQWKSVRNSLGMKELKRTIEIDQFEIANSPEKLADNLKTFLNLNEQQKKILINTFERRTPEKTSNSYKPLSFEKLEWSKEEKDCFMKVAGKTMEEYGYSLNESYYL